MAQRLEVALVRLFLKALPSNVRVQPVDGIATGQEVYTFCIQTELTPVSA